MIAAHFTESAAVGDDTAVKAALRWLADRQQRQVLEVDRVPWAELGDWHFEDRTGNLVHRTGRFFAVEGLRVRTNAGPVPEWDQPILHQPEIGVLGFVVKRIDGVLHCLMQAKFEPGNSGLVQISPTVQATRSNFTRAHRGAAPRYAEYFLEPGRGTVLVDTLQSELGGWFYAKHNRNIVVEITEDPPPHDNFRWMTIGDIHRVLAVDHAVNMDARSVLSCLPFARPTSAPRGDFAAALRASWDVGDVGAVLGWLTDRTAQLDLRADRIPLAAVRGWHRTADAVTHDRGRHFDIVGVRVAAENREVTSWTQPLLAPRERGLAAFVVRTVDGVLRILAHARPEAGSPHGVELAPTVECQPPSAPPFLDHVRAAPPDRIRYDTVLSEEGGRFLHADSRYLIVEAGDEFPLDVPPDYRWLTAGEWTHLLRHRNYVTMPARTLVAALRSLC